MANQYGATNISDADRNTILEHYKTGIGVDTMVKEGLSPYGHVITKRVIRESHLPIMPKGNQVKYPPGCPENKVCCRCGVEKPREAFGLQKCKDGLRSDCRACRTGVERTGSRRRKYGISAEDYDIMFVAQNGLCASCGKPETSRKRQDRYSLSIDHSHQTGKVRHLLCHRCNLVVGLVKEDPDVCELLKQYALRIREEG